MSESLPYHFLTTAFDPALLVRPFAVQTQWHVLTGAACTGKTTMINQLAAQGFQTVPETARQYIDRELAKGRTFAEMFGNAADELAITQMQQAIEQTLSPRDTIFLDRALPDSITFYRFCGLDPNDILPACLQNRYATVFVLNRLPFCQDGARLDDDPTANLLDEWLARDYSGLGYDVVRVPVLPREERLAFLFDCLTARGFHDRRASPAGR